MQHNEFYIDEIRKLTCISLPTDNAYLFRLGVSLYGFASIHNFLAEIISHFGGNVDRTKLQDKSGNDLAKMLINNAENIRAKNPELFVLANSAAKVFKILNTERNDIAHSYSITNSSKNQILHRRKDDDGKYFEITNEFLNNFISRLDDVSNNLYQIRAILKPEL